MSLTSEIKKIAEKSATMYRLGSITTPSSSSFSL